MTALEEFKTEIKNKDFLSDDIMNKAEKLGEELRGISTTKMRQYFDDIKGLQRIIESNPKPEQIKVKLQLIKSRIHYDLGRKKVSPALKDFLVACIDKVQKSNNANLNKTAKDFTVFFENFYGYFYYKAQK
jgi:CRISPR type III-A-associated protein Csm2